MSYGIFNNCLIYSAQGRLLIVAKCIMLSQQPKVIMSSLKVVKKKVIKFIASP